MTDTESDHHVDESIAEKRRRLEDIIERLEDGEVTIERAKALHEEGRGLLEVLEDELSLGDGDVIERE